MATKRNNAGYSMIELVVVCMLAAIGLALIMPRARSNEATLSTRATAEELVARLRRARQTAITKGVPVGVAVPVDGSHSYSDTLYQLEGEINPDITSTWSINQPHYETVFFVGQWVGPDWEQAPRMEGTGQHFDLDTWFEDDAPPANMIVFTSAGDAVSNMQAADGMFRIVVAQGVVADSNLSAAKAPFTVSVAPSGEASLMQGVYDGPTITPSYDRITAVRGAVFERPPLADNEAPVVMGLTAIPDANNPNGSGKQLDLDNVLNLEVRVADANGDPPYFKWKCLAVEDRDENALDPLTQGGRFSTEVETRMEWDVETRQWVGRTTWAPAPGDLGGNAYQLVCDIRDREGGTTTTGFPVDGQWLRTIEQNWVLYRTIGPSGHWEVWKMNLEGEQHQRLVGFDYQDVIYASWSADGEEIVFGAPDGIYRALKDGGDQRRIANNTVGEINGVAMSTRGDAVYYTGGGGEDKRIRKVFLDGTVEVDLQLADFGATDDIYGLTTFERPSDGRSFAAMGYYRHWDTLLGTERRHGLMVVDLVTGGNSGNDEDGPGVWDQAQDRGTNFGPVFYKTSDGQTHAIWGSNSGILRKFAVTFDPGAHFGIAFGPQQNLDTGLGGYVTDPRVTPDGAGMCFTRGTGAGSQIYYMEDINTPSGVVNLPVAPGTTGGMGAQISRPF